MDKFQLEWVGPFKVSELRKLLFDESINEFPIWMTFQGIYMFLDQSFRALYVGKTDRRVNALRARIREHLKGQTDFSNRLKANDLKIDDMLLIAVLLLTNYHKSNNLLVL